jgi:hypothetical protein
MIKHSWTCLSSPGELCLKDAPVSDADICVLLLCILLVQRRLSARSKILAKVKSFACRWLTFMSTMRHVDYTTDALADFVDRYFAPAGSDVLPATPVDWHSRLPFAKDIKNKT